MSEGDHVWKALIRRLLQIETVMVLSSHRQPLWLPCCDIIRQAPEADSIPHPSPALHSSLPKALLISQIVQTLLH